MSYCSQQQISDDEEDMLSDGDLDAASYPATKRQLQERKKFIDWKDRTNDDEDHKMSYRKLRKRQIKDLAKIHALDVITYRVNRKLADQAA